jgi:hypothetical protein
MPGGLDSSLYIDHTGTTKFLNLDIPISKQIYIKVRY